MAYGGAGIFLSKNLMKKINQPGICKFFPFSSFSFLSFFVKKKENEMSD